MKKYFEVNPKRSAAAVLTAAVLLSAMGLAIAGDGAQARYIALSVLICALAVACIFSRLHYGRAISLLISLLIPVLALIALENYTFVITNLTVKIFILNLLFLYFLYGLMIFALGSVFRGVLTATLVPMLFGLANYYVFTFRGTMIVPWDFYSIRTAASVADNYSFTITWKVCFSIILFVLMIVAASKSDVRLKKPQIRIPSAAVFLLALGVYVVSIQYDSVQTFFGMDKTLFTINVFYRNNGIAAAFLGNLHFLRIEEPDGYSADKVEEIAEGYGEDEDTAAGDVTEYANIIVLMNETFSDLSVWGDFETSEEVMPNFRAYQDECIGGEIYVSVKGGNTANTEYEFLTGDTMGFLPAGSVPYQQYIKSEMPAMPSYLKSLGYDTLAVHPYNATGWDRDKVYEYFGFDEFLSRKDFHNPETMRDYVSDSAAFEKIIEEYEKKDEDSRLFAFEVTMQNHGGYSKESPGFDIYLTLPEVTSKSTQVTALEKYLTLMNESDKALGEIVEYFRDVDEPTVIVMFGDHQPSDYITNMVQRIVGVDEPETVEEIQQGYRVPFVIWTNYDVEPVYYEGTSVNYLGGLVLQAAGVPLTDYQEYLMNLMQTLPIINANAIRDANGTFYGWDETDAYTETLNEYQMLTYNHLVDRKHRVNWFFGGEDS